MRNRNHMFKSERKFEKRDRIRPEKKSENTPAKKIKGKKPASGSKELFPVHSSLCIKGNSSSIGKARTGAFVVDHFWSTMEKKSTPKISRTRNVVVTTVNERRFPDLRCTCKHPSCTGNVSACVAV
ncbi:hypothetical protein RUM44_000106 [Polyplax serrata]|uniref:Post-SET domain-containing protein n=1 Tax=Polyplax serrata TaxID=468196 RepID=A0ABR1B4K8_POLSC